MNYQEFKEAVIKAAKEKGIEKYELYYESQEGTEVETYQDRIESFSVKEGGGACFRCIYGGKAGYAATELFSEDTVGRLVAHAIENAADPLYIDLESSLKTVYISVYFYVIHSIKLFNACTVRIPYLGIQCPGFIL